MDLKKNAPKGEFLAYINKEEAALLKKRGGSGKLVNGIPSYRRSNYDGSGGGFDGPGKSDGPGSNSPPGDNRGDADDRRQNYNVDKKNVKTGPKKTDTKTVTGKDTGKGSSYEKAEKKFKEAVDDYTKAQKISGYKPLNLNYLPVIGPTRKIFGTPFTIKGKTNMAKRRMEYINSLPPAQRKAMIERLGYAVDEEYDELDEQAFKFFYFINFV